MKNLVTIFSACLIAVLNGCAVQTADEREVALNGQALTTDECDADRNDCVDGLNLITLGVGIIACNADHIVCLQSADDGLPAEVTAAVVAAVDCTSELDECVFDAQTPSELTACAEGEVVCVAGVLDVVDLPTIVDDTSACADSAVECINAATSVSELTACAEGLGGCAVEAADAAIDDIPLGDIVGDITDLPANVQVTVDEVTACAGDLTACISAASSPSQLTACSETSAECVATTLDVDLPNVVPVTDVVECAETASECTLEVSSLSDVGACADALISCAEAVVDAINVPAPVNCNAQWTSCMFSNPFGFAMCAQELQDCL